MNCPGLAQSTTRESRPAGGDHRDQRHTRDSQKVFGSVARDQATVIHRDQTNVQQYIPPQPSISLRQPLTWKPQPELYSHVECVSSECGERWADDQGANERARQNRYRSSSHFASFPGLPGCAGDGSPQHAGSHQSAGPRSSRLAWVTLSGKRRLTRSTG